VHGNDVHTVVYSTRGRKRKNVTGGSNALSNSGGEMSRKRFTAVLKKITKLYFTTHSVYVSFCDGTIVYRRKCVFNVNCVESERVLTSALGRFGKEQNETKQRQYRVNSYTEIKVYNTKCERVIRIEKKK